MLGAVARGRGRYSAMFFAASAGLAAVAACAIDVRGTLSEARADAAAPSGPDATTAPDGATSTPDASPDAGGDPRCRGTRGPTAVHVGAYCIDRTEVTRADYAAFLSAPLPFASQPTACAWNTSYGSVGAPDALPVASVDWCDARAFCEWAGKRLCTRAEWRGACSAAGEAYPYGAGYEDGRCNDKNAARSGPVAVGSLSCAGALGVHDMLGNVWEWIDDCGNGGAGAPCAFGYGGAWGHTYSCDQTASGFTRASSAGDVGFRCCSDLE
jgi:formylglycine-generating enzyme